MPPDFCLTTQRFDLALYELQDATLAGIEGQGYVFPVDTFEGKQYRGVFFANDDEAAISTDIDEATFEGTIYHKTTSGEGDVTVDVTNIVDTAVGKRADFKVV
ncbi:MAG: hypothetical protein AAGK21_15385 [Bacteroidota bacterium]